MSESLSRPNGASDTTQDWTAADEMEMLVDKWRDRIAFIFEGQQISFGAFEARANRYAHWARSCGLAAGDVVALFMQDRPEFVAAWFGMTKLGVATALVNSQLVGAGLAHCVRIARAKLVIVGEELIQVWQDAALLLDPPLTAWVVGDGAAIKAAPAKCENLDRALAAQTDERLPASSARPGLSSRALQFYVYTSGTTGLPKAVSIPGSKLLRYLAHTDKLGSLGPTDRAYVVLPLYHGVGGFSGVSWGLATGGGIVLRRKFSLSQFWKDVVEHKVTTFFYVGEICRYLVNAPERPEDQLRRLNLAFGSGMREDVWRRFVDRFKPNRIIEFYGSTEGPTGMINGDGKIGAVGKLPPDGPATVRLVRLDPETQEPIRREGLCIEAAVDEPGEAVGMLRPGEGNNFEGYANNPAATEATLLRNVFSPGDSWYRSGDLLRKDAEGYFYFLDRMGDTFRWKGENVATTEVAQVLRAAPCVAEVAVYGVRAPHHEGRAGMAAITLQGERDLASIAHHVQALPTYARPIFLRFTDGLSLTGTYKIQKTDLVRDGFDPSAIADPVFFWDSPTGTYRQLGREHFEEIASGARRL